MLHLIKHPHIGQIPQGMESLGMLLFPDSNTLMGPRSFSKVGEFQKVLMDTDEPLVLIIGIDKVYIV